MRFVTPLAYALVKLVCWAVLRLAFGLEVHGRHHVPPRGAFVVASNHFSYLDPLVVGVACPHRLTFMARQTLFDSLLMGLFLRAVGVIPLKRGEGDVEAIREAIARLGRGQPVALFPEGARQLTGRLGQARRGIGLIAVKARVPVIPVLVQGTFEALPSDARRLRRAKIRVAFGPQIPYTKPPLREGALREHEQHLADAVTTAWRRLAERLPQESRSVDDH